MNLQEIALEKTIIEIFTNENHSIYVEDNDGNYLKVNYIEIGFDYIQIIYNNSYTLIYSLADYEEKTLNFYKKY